MPTKAETHARRAAKAAKRRRQQRAARARALRAQVVAYRARRVAAVRQQRHEDLVHALVQSGNMRMMQRSIDAGISVLEQDRTWFLQPRCTALHSACRGGNVPNAQFLLDTAVVQGVLPELLAATDEDGKTPLHVAVEHMRKSCMALLLEYGADPDALGEYTTTPMAIACRNGDADAVALLLAHGADVRQVPYSVMGSSVATIVESFVAHASVLPACFAERSGDMTATMLAYVLTGNVWDDDEAMPVVGEIGIDDDLPFADSLPPYPGTTMPLQPSSAGFVHVEVKLGYCYSAMRLALFLYTSRASALVDPGIPRTRAHKVFPDDEFILPDDECVGHNGRHTHKSLSKQRAVALPKWCRRAPGKYGTRRSGR